MKNMITFPPFYFFSIIALDFIFYLFFQRLPHIPFPFNLTGLFGIIAGYYIAKKNCDIFNSSNTTFRLERPSVFVKEGYYNVSRNPMYLGLLIIIFGLSILLGNLLCMACPLLFFVCINYICIPPEEKIMEKTFGESYIKYKKKVRRWI